MAVNTFQAGAVQRAFQVANEQFKLLVVRYSSKGQHRGRMIAEVSCLIKLVCVCNMVIDVRFDATSTQLGWCHATTSPLKSTIS